jgi:hypothetical protein
VEFIFGIVVLALDIWALVNVWQSPSSAVAKILWTLGIVILPVIGFVVWFLFGPKGDTRAMA